MSFDESGATVNVGVDNHVHLSVTRFGRGDVQRTVPAGVWHCRTSQCATIERPHGTLSHWFMTVAGEVEEGFTILAPPAGSGLVTIDMRIDGASYRAGKLITPRGSSLGYDRLQAWDSTGHQLPITIDAIPDGVRFTVDDSNAVYPIIVDPMISQEPVSTFAPGGTTCEVFAAGEVDGDDIGDFAIVSDTAVVVYRGRFHADGPITEPAWTLPHSETVLIVTAAGDVNADGFGDLILTAPEATDTVAGEGRAWLHLGVDVDLNQVPAWSFASGVPDAGLGRRVVANLDVNGDGYADAIFAAPNEVASTGVLGVLYVFHGSSDGFANAPDARIEAAVGWTTTDPPDVSIARVPDIDGDGRDEFAWAHRTLSTASVDMYFGAASGLPQSPDQILQIEGYAEVDRVGDSGDSIAIAGGDFDGDGRGDLLAQSWTQVGNAWVRGLVAHVGAPEGISASPSWRFADPTYVTCEPSDEGTTEDVFVADSEFGRTLELADFDGDDRDDIMASGTAANEDGENVYFIASRTSGRLGDFRTPQGHGRALGDIDDDGLADVAFPNDACQVALHSGREGLCLYDADGDTICDEADNCYTVFNPAQLDADDDDVGDACSERDGGCAEAATTGMADTGGLDPLGSSSGSSGRGSGETGSAQDTDGSSSTGGLASTGTGATSSGAGLGNTAAETGCSCKQGGGTGAPAWLALGFLGLLLRRRRHVVVGASLLAACATEIRPDDNGASGTGGMASTTGPEDGSGEQGGTLETSGDSTGVTAPVLQCCAEDGAAIIDCATGEEISPCTDSGACDPTSVTCVDGCELSAEENSSEGCRYYAITASTQTRACFAAAVSNNWLREAHLSVRYRGEEIDISRSLVAARNTSQGAVWEGLIPPDEGVPPGTSAILLLQGDCGALITGAAPAIPEAWADMGGPGDSKGKPGGAPVGSSLRGHGIQISSDMPVTVHQYMAFSHGHGALQSAAPLSGSLLLAAPSWQRQFVTHAVADDAPTSYNEHEYLVVVADEDDTRVTVASSSAVLNAGEMLPAVGPDESAEFVLAAGEAAIYRQSEPGATSLEADKPIGVWRMANCALIPNASAVHQCDRAEQMLPPVRTLGAEYIAAPMRRGPADEPILWRLVGVVDGTELSYSADVGGPATIDRGEAVWLPHTAAFSVQSQDAEHPFYLFHYLSSPDASPGLRELADTSAASGGAEFAIAVTPKQFLSSYTYYADPRWDTSLVLARLPADAEHESIGGGYPEVRLDCGEGDTFVVNGWNDIPGTDPAAQHARVSLPGSCSGTIRVHAPSPFGLHVWGLNDGISYGVPAGMGLDTLNDLVVLPEG